MRTFPRSVAAALVAAICAGVPGPLAAQSIAGTLLEDPTNRPISGASVSLVAAPSAQVAAAVTTGNDGGFSLRAPGPGIYRLLATLPGYRTALSPAIALQTGDQVNFTWRIVSDTFRLRPIVVTANTRENTNRIGGFADRMRRNAFGRFITRDQLDKIHPIWVTDALRTMPGLQVVPSPRGFGYDVLTTEGCRPNVYLDGLRFPLMGETIDQIVSPSEIDGIEVYAHAAEVPAEFQSVNNSCGAIVIWTRRGP
jgi:hypothetical protein